jgi:hypothetical protein
MISISIPIDRPAACSAVAVTMAPLNTFSQNRKFLFNKTL